MSDLARKVAELEGLVRALQNRVTNSAGRGVLMSSDDTTGVQKQRISGVYGEELTDVQLWQPFGLSAQCPPGGDVIMLSMSGNRDGVQALAATHPGYRPGGGNVGETILYDAGGQQVALGVLGITIKDQYGSIVRMAPGGALTITATDVEITSGTLTHNGVDIGHKHEHTRVASGTAISGPPK